MILTLLMFHGFLAVILIGAVSHQALSFWKPHVGSGHHIGTRFRAVRSSTYTNAVVLLYVVTVIGGAVVYPTYVLDVKKPLLDMDLKVAVGVFEVKEHSAIIGLGLLPAYLHYWKNAATDQDLFVRRALTILIAIIVWWNFVIGHILTAIRGVF